MTTRVLFFSGELEMEGLLTLNRTDKGAIIAHPHPLYGGDMYNPVVQAISEAYEEKGFSTLRFNFRGVGASQGHYDDGVGEAIDIESAVAFIRSKGISHVDLAGYSFGAWVIAKVPPDPSRTGRVIFVSPPVAFMDMPASLKIPNLHLVVTGDEDDIAPPNLIKQRLPHWHPDARLEILNGTDHFYGYATDTLRKTLLMNI